MATVAVTIGCLLISFIWIILGTLLIIYTSKSIQVLQKVFYTDKVKLLAIIPTVFGIILVIGSFYQQEMLWLAFILGLISLLKGVYLFISPKSRIKKNLDWWFNRAGDVTFRFFGLVIFTLGITLLSYLKV